jgi:hypothetical protein
VICTPSDTPGLQRCRIGNYNLSAIILAAGGGRATPDASEELQAAEDQARSARLGVWRRGRLSLCQEGDVVLRLGLPRSNRTVGRLRSWLATALIKTDRMSWPPLPGWIGFTPLF